MDIKVKRQNASGWVGVTVKITDPQSEFVGEEGVVTNALPAADGSVWSLHVRPVKFPKLDLPLILAPDGVERINGLGSSTPN